jgi:hypothetical protein
LQPPNLIDRWHINILLTKSDPNRFLPELFRQFCNETGQAGGPPIPSVDVPMLPMAQFRPESVDKRLNRNTTSSFFHSFRSFWKVRNARVFSDVGMRPMVAMFDLLRRGKKLNERRPPGCEVLMMCAILDAGRKRMIKSSGSRRPTNERARQESA